MDDQKKINGLVKSKGYTNQYVVYDARNLHNFNKAPPELQKFNIDGFKYHVVSSSYTSTHFIILGGMTVGIETTMFGRESWNVNTSTIRKVAPLVVSWFVTLN